MPTIRLALASPSSLVRAGLVEGFGAADGFEVVLVAASWAAAREASFAAAQVAVVDVGDDDLVEVDSAPGDGPALVLLAPADDDRLGEWMIDGCAVLPREASIAAIAAAIGAVAAGLVAMPPAFAAEALRFERVGERRAPRPTHDALTPRERQVLLAMSHGLGNREIGGTLGISAHTAKFHVAQIIAKLQAQSRAHAVAKALRAGLVDV